MTQALNIKVDIISACIGRPIFFRMEVTMAKKGMRDFALQEENGNEIGFFSSKSPSQAALKAAKRGHKDIRIRELGTKKVHVFAGERVQVDKS